MFKKTIPILVFLLIFSSGLARQAQATEKEDDLFFVAQKAFEDGFYDVALRYLDQFLKGFPQTTKRPQVLLLIGQCYFFDNQYLKAFDQFESLLKSPGEEEIKDAVLFWMGEVYLKSKDYKQAESFYKRLIDEFPVSAYLPQGYYSLGWTYSEQGLYEEAITAFSEVIKRYPANNLVEEAHFKTGESFLNLKKYPEAIERFNTYLKKYPESSRLDQAYFFIAEANYYLENFEPAIKNYSQVISITKDERLANLARISSGWSYLRMKKYPESQNMFEQAEAVAVAKNLELDEILLGKASLFAQMEDYTKGLVAYEEIIAKLPNSRWLIDAKLGRGNCLHELGRYQEAVAAFQDILDRFSSKKEFSEQIEKVYFGLGWSYLKLGKPKEAIDSFRKVMEISPDKAVRLSALCQIGDIYQDMGELQSAVDTYDRILKDYPDSLYTDYIQYRDGIALLKMDKEEAATLIFQGLSKNFPKSRFVTDAQYYLGMAYFKKGDFVASKEQFEDLLERLPRDSEYRPDMMYSLGLNLAYLKEYKKAVDVFERLKRDYPQNDELMQRADLEIGNDLSQWGKEQDAVKKFKLILYKYPKSAVGQKANLWLGDYYLKTGKLEMARKYLNDCLKDYPDSDKTDEARYLLGLTFKNERRYDEALSEFKAILAKQNSVMSVDANLAVADILSETAKPEEAASIYQNIVAQHPEAARDAYVKLGELYSKGSYFEKAIEAYQKALNLAVSDASQTGNSQIQFKLAEAIEGTKDLNLAIENYLKIPYLYPNETHWVVKSYLRVGRIFEDKENWEEAKKIYEKIAKEDVEEAKFATERLDWIKDNVKK